MPSLEENPPLAALRTRRRGRHVPVIPPETTSPSLGTMAPTVSTGRALRSAGPTIRTSVAAKQHKGSAKASGHINAIVAWDRIRPWFALERARRPPTDLLHRRQVVAACQVPCSHPPRVTRHDLESRVRDNHRRGRRGQVQRSRDLPRDLPRSVNGGTSRSPRGQRQKMRLRRPKSRLTFRLSLDRRSQKSSGSTPRRRERKMKKLSGEQLR